MSKSNFVGLLKYLEVENSNIINNAAKKMLIF